MTRRRLTMGGRGEQIAADYLKGLGYRIQERNYRCRQGEVDIVAWQGAALVFVEVRTRSGEDLGPPLVSVDCRKQARITLVALAYIQEHEVRDTEMRFDVVAVGCIPGRPPMVMHVPAAFDASPLFPI